MAINPGATKTNFMIMSVMSEIEVSLSGIRGPFVVFVDAQPSTCSHYLQRRK